MMAPNLDEPSNSHVKQIELIELPIRERQSIKGLPNPMPKSESGNSIHKSWFEDFSRIKHTENSKSIYCISCNRAIDQYRLKMLTWILVRIAPLLGKITLRGGKFQERS